MNVENKAVALPRPTTLHRTRIPAWFRSDALIWIGMADKIWLIQPVYFDARVNKAAPGSGLRTPKRPTRFRITVRCSGARERPECADSGRTGIEVRLVSDMKQGDRKTSRVRPPSV